MAEDEPEEEDELDETGGFFPITNNVGSNTCVLTMSLGVEEPDDDRLSFGTYPKTSFS